MMAQPLDRNSDENNLQASMSAGVGWSNYALSDLVHNAAYKSGQSGQVLSCSVAIMLHDGSSSM